MGKPVSQHLENVMRNLPLPSQEINPGARGRLLQTGYATIIQAPSPYKKHKGGLIDFYALTDKGRQRLKDGI